MEIVYDKATGDGSALFGMCADENYLYVLYDERSDHEKTAYLKVYDRDYQEVKSIHIDPALRESTLYPFISDMAVMGDYIYTNNASNCGFLGKIEGDELVTVRAEEGLELAFSPAPDASPVFYVRRTNRCFFLDVDTGHIQDFEMQIDGDYSLTAIYSERENVYILCIASQKPYLTYFMSKKDMVGAHLTA